MTYTKLTYNIKAPKPYLFIGSKIRGALGYALKEEVCINPSFVCKDCFAQKECIFYDMYEKQNSTHSYRLDFKLYSKKYKFSILLFGELQNHKESINKAILKSLDEYKSIEVKEKTKTLKSKKHSSIIKLEFITPLRIKKQNHFALHQDEIGLNDILFSIHRRNLELQKKSFKKVKFNQDIKIISKNLQYKELTRKSNKQNTKMNMGGLMGEIILSGVDKQTYDLLKLGEIIGVGKSTVFGLGKIKVEDIE
ncbi:MAG: CRISPR system precrRNA processing endoribonuclease RAMP protein Cas6 [Campylobacterales bacterium]|nr:CRISPR system precrRNA processing endoribonuclease RAMP protein Cas6 [Campylobacterales bacterium]